MDYKILTNSLLVSLLTHIDYIEQQVLQIDKLGITMNEINTLDAISDVSPTTMSNVARKLYITQSTLTTAINKLEKKGFVKRYRDRDDARQVRLEITKRGQRILLLHQEFRDKMIDEFLGGLDEEEEAVLLKVLLKLQNVIETNYMENSR